MSKQTITIELPNGAKAGWPVLVQALRVAQDKTGFLLIFGDLIQQIEAQAIPKPQVYEHIVVSGPRAPQSAICGKVWEPSEYVTIVGKCPECVAQAARWVA